MGNQSVLIPLPGEYPVAPIIRLKPTAQRSAPVAQAGWRWRRRYAIFNGANEPLVNFPYAINLGDTTPLTTTKALANGNDLRAWRQGREIARTLVDWDSATHDTLCWITIPYQQVGETAVYDIVYGNALAGAPPELLHMLDAPAFDLSLTGADRCDNDLWVYMVEADSANAGKGAWPLSSGTVRPRPNLVAPGGWRPEATLLGPDDRSQPYATTFEDSGTYYHATLNARRARAGSIVVNEDIGPDGVTLTVPTGIASITTDFVWRNDPVSDSDATPIGRLMVLARERAGDIWYPLAQFGDLNPDGATIAPDTYAPANPVKSIGCAVWPRNDLMIDFSARSDRYVEASWDTVLEVALDDSLVTQTLVEAETEIYEIANEIRYGGGAYGEGPFGVYQVARLGNATLADGRDTPRLAVEIDQQVHVDNERRIVAVYDDAGTTKVEDVPIPAYNLMEAVDRDGTFVEQFDPDWLYLLPVKNPLTNPSFASDADDWTVFTPWTPLGAFGSSLVKFQHKADAITGLSDGNQVASWTDSSGNAKHAANATSGEQPTYQTNEINGMPVVRFDSTDDDLTITGHGLTKPCTIAMVMKSAAADSSDRFISSTNMMVTRVAGPLFSMSGGPTYGTHDTNVHVHVLGFAATGDQYGSLDGTVTTGGAAAGAPSANLVLNSGGAANVAGMDLGEIVAIQGALSVDDRQKLEGYLAHRWGLAANLPSDHPYKTTPPGDVGGDSHPNITHGGLSRTIGSFDSDPASGTLTITVNTADADDGIDITADDYLPVGGQPSVWFGMAVRTNDTDLVPRLQFRFYDEALDPVGSTVTRQAEPLAAINTWERRVAAAVPPEGAVYWRAGLRWEDTVGGTTGQAWWDTVEIGAPELAVYDPSPNPGTLELRYSVKPRYAYA